MGKAPCQVRPPACACLECPQCASINMAAPSLHWPTWGTDVLDVALPTGFARDCPEKSGVEPLVCKCLQATEVWSYQVVFGLVS